MIYLDTFDTKQAFNEGKENLVEPWVALTEDDSKVHYNTITYEMVDLGLPSGTLWANKNIGAETEIDCGKYFQWGDTIGYEGDEAKAHSTWSTCPFNGGSSDFDYDAFNFASGTAFLDGVLAAEYDAATQIIGSDWKMPTKADFEELIANTTYEWVEDYNDSGVKGGIFRSKINMDKYIFIPASGDYSDGDSSLNKLGYLNSSTISNMLSPISTIPNYVLCFIETSADVNNEDERYYARPIRGILK